MSEAKDSPETVDAYKSEFKRVAEEVLSGCGHSGAQDGFLLHFNEGDDWIYVAVPGAQADAIHYELIRHGNDEWFVELHIEVPSRFVKAWKRLEEVMKAHRRQLVPYGYYSSRYWRMRSPVVSRSDIEQDFRELVKIVAPVFKDDAEEKGKEDSEPASTEDVSMESNVLVRDLIRKGSLKDGESQDGELHKELCIPDYQREYCWTRVQVEQLLESIWYFPWNQTDSRLHLGTVVLHETDDGKMNVVDGQQRLITLSLLYLLDEHKRDEDLDLNSEEKLSLLERSDCSWDSKRHVYWNARIISEWVKAHSSEEKANWWKHIQVDTIIVHGNKNLGLVYTFFNAMNSAGKKLSDYDLLKPHHLRYLTDQDPQGYYASEWDSFVQEKIATFGGESASLADELLNCNLYRLRSWLRSRGISFDRHHVFRHYSAYEALMGARGNCVNQALDAGICGGRAMFCYVEQFADRYRQFVQTETVKALHGFPSSWRHLPLLRVVRAVLFQYYCKFGETYLPDALLFILDRIGKIRAVESRIQSARLLQNPLVSHTVMALDEATVPEFFLKYCVLPTNRYAHEGIDDDNGRHVKPAFWEGVKEMHRELEKHLAFSDTSEFKAMKADLKIEV